MDLQRLIDTANKVVFLGGAGVSTESGIPDFRSATGIYSHTPEEILDISYFNSHPAEFYDFLRKYMLYPDAKPNKAHFALAELERVGKLKCVITQNIDGLHQLAGSRDVIELHGTLMSFPCTRCGKRYPLSRVLACEGVAKCDCGGILRPDIVFYSEALDESRLMRAASEISSADLLIVGGTSLAVYPAAGLVRYISAKKLVIINKSTTPYDNEAALVIHDSIGETLSRLKINNFQ